MKERLENLRVGLRQAAGARAKLLVVWVTLSAMARKALGRGPGSAVAIPMKALGGASISVRPGTSDLVNAVAYYNHSLHLPPPEIAMQDLTSICELGSNIGASLTALAATYPSARLLGIEPDATNSEIARRNLAQFGSRTEIVTAAIWDRPAELRVNRDVSAGAHGFVVAEGEGDGESLDALTIDELLERAPGGDVDYMHVSIEGSEPRVFAAGGAWPSRVRSLRVELHPYFDYDAERCIDQLTGLGYRAWVDPELPDKWVYAVRDESASSSQTRS